MNNWSKYFLNVTDKESCFPNFWNSYHVFWDYILQIEMKHLFLYGYSNSFIPPLKDVTVPSRNYLCTPEPKRVIATNHAT